MNNATYGTTMQNMINRVDVRLVYKGKYYLKWTSKPNLVTQKNI